MSDTPETDALVTSINSDTDIIRHEHDFCEMTWLARRLERERDEARRYANKIDLCQSGVAPCDLAVKLMAELNKARQQLAELGESKPQENPTRHCGRVEKTEQILQQ